MLKASVAILSYNGGAVLRETLEAVLKQRQDVLHEVLVIDSGSRDDSVDYLRHRPVRLVEISNADFGHGATRNLAAQLAEAPVVVFLSQDATPSGPEWLDTLVASLADEHVAGVYGRQLPRAATHVCERFFLTETYPDRPARRTLAKGQQPTLRDIFFSNVNVACRRELLMRFPFDRSLVMSEDQQWARTVLENGYGIVYEPRAAVYHSHRYTCADVFRRYFDSGASLRQIVAGRLGTSPGEQVKYLWRECREAVRDGGIVHVPYVLAYEACRILGYTAGKAEPLLPLPVKTALSANVRHWRKVAMAPKEGK